MIHLLIVSGVHFSGRETSDSLNLQLPFPALAKRVFSRLAMTVLHSEAGQNFHVAGPLAKARQWKINPTQPVLSQIDRSRENQRQKSVQQVVK